MSNLSEARYKAHYGVIEKGQTVCVVQDLSSDTLEDDLDLNKTYPCTRRPLYNQLSLLGYQRCYYPDLLTGQHLDLCSLAKRGNNRISSFLAEAKHSSSFLQHLPTLSEAEENFFKQLMSGEFELTGKPAALNPNKVILRVNPRTRQVLSANEQASKLFECSGPELNGRTLSCILKRNVQILVGALGEEYPLKDGTVAAVSGKVLDAVTPSGDVPVSVITQRPSQTEEILHLIIGNVERLSAFLSFSQDGCIQTCDTAFAHILGYQSPEELIGMSVNELIPSLQISIHSHALPKMLRVQRVCGKTRDGTLVPLCVKLQAAVHCGKNTVGASDYLETSKEDGRPAPLNSSKQEASPNEHSIKVDGTSICSSPKMEYSGTVWAFAPVGSLLLLSPNGAISSIHSHLALSLFGYSEDELLGKSITVLMPGFYGWMSDPLFPDSQAGSPASFKMSRKSDVDPSSLVAGDMAMVQQAMLARTATGRGRIFTETNNSSRLERPGTALSTLSPPVVASTRMVAANDTTELIKEAAQAVPCSSQLDCVDDTQLLLKTLALVDPPEEHTQCSTHSELQNHKKEEPHGSGTQTSINADDKMRANDPTVKTVQLSDLSILQNSSFEVISLESRSSSGFCEKFAGQGGSDPAQVEDFHSALEADSASCFLDINSNGDVVTRALADLELNSSIEMVSGGGYNNRHSMSSCDTEELLQTPSPCVIESDDETEPVQDRNAAPEGKFLSEDVKMDTGKQDHWGVVSAIGKEKSHECCEQINAGVQSLTDIPATSTPKKQKTNEHSASSDSESILEGQFKGSGYHRDGTIIEVHCDVCRIKVSDGSLMFCVWVSRPGQQWALTQTESSLHNQSRASLQERIGDVSQREAMRSSMDFEQSRACDGQFEEEYQPVKAVGKGAFGFVWRAIRRCDGQEVIVKFISKARIVSDCWVDDPMLGRVSQEIAILTRVQHHNIVKVLEVFENGSYFQMVMEKHGDVLDLFEFIDMHPRLDEPLGSYIFRQERL
ncbi:PAS domain-containing serine/threonine-protein kinase isoform X2 [Gouania willdenowi]|uniref:PAS domain-containing serine/threonine-protein kinase isoform X2 n=1 Tax=Gouania willdenowi TaxID=441366 RepID=UPI00105431F0|nr:PAS domain-containing serine/threonine-protein kinase isoform X2 [Gouania willdenowi]